MKLSFKVCLAALLATTLAHAQAPEISSARIVQPPPGAKVAAAYFTVENTSETPLVITGASSSAAKKVEIHLSEVINDVATMTRQESITIEAGSSLDFKHGSYHLMLMGLNAPLSPGTMLTFEIDTSAGVLPIMIPVITPDEASSMQSHSMNHDTMDHGSMEKEPATMKHGDMNHSDMKHGDMDESKSTDKN